MRKAALLLLLATFLSGCETAPSDVACPSLPAYSKELQAKGADEVDALPEGSVIPVFVVDYQKMRDGVRACIKARGTK